jgi:hypothetical protein
MKRKLLIPAFVGVLTVFSAAVSSTSAATLSPAQFASGQMITMSLDDAAPIVKPGH